MAREATTMKADLPSAEEMFRQSMKTKKILEKAHQERRRLRDRLIDAKNVKAIAKAK